MYVYFLQKKVGDDRLVVRCTFLITWYHSACATFQVVLRIEYVIKALHRSVPPPQQRPSVGLPALRYVFIQPVPKPMRLFHPSDAWGKVICVVHVVSVVRARGGPPSLKSPVIMVGRVVVPVVSPFPASTNVSRVAARF